LEIGGGEYQLAEEQLERAIDVPVEELEEVNLSEEEAEKKISEETAELKSAAEWKVKSTRREDNMGDRYDLPFHQHKEEMQQRSLHERKRHPTKKLEEVI
jgi:hypothetical protein